MSVETIERIKYATAPIVCVGKTPDGIYKPQSFVGSAFFINEEGYFVTATHVLVEVERRAGSTTGCAPALYLPLKGWIPTDAEQDIQLFTIDVCFRDEPTDIAVCRPKESPFKNPKTEKIARFVTLASRGVHPDGTPVAFTGYPVGLSMPVTSKANIASYVGAPDNLIVIDKTAWPGASGSPLYLADGSVVGVIIMKGDNDASGMAFARRVEMLVAILDKAKTSYVQQKQK